MKFSTRSIWFPLLLCIVLAGATTASYTVLQPSESIVGQMEIAHIFSIGAWALGAVMGLLSFICICILNVLRRIIHLRNIKQLDSLVVLICVLPWLIFAWNLTGEPEYTPIARAIIHYAARPMLWGSAVTVLVASIVLIIQLIPKKP